MELEGIGIWKWLAQRALALVIAVAATLGVFLVLPLMQSIGEPNPRDLMVTGVDVSNLPPPPPPPPEQQEQEEEPEEPPPPELVEQAPPLDLAQLELSLSPSFGGGAGVADFSIQLMDQMDSGEGSEELDRIFSLTELDQKPRVIFQRQPSYPQELRKRKRRGTVYVVFLVSTEGRVLQPKVEKSTDPAFERPALEAVRQWRFEPGTRNGEKVQFKLRIPITFNAG